MIGIELLNASAGSGKTHSLTGKIIECLKSGIEPESLMATTFTNKAAAELRERIRLQLLKYNKLDEAQRIFDGFVGTINSICARLLSEYALDAGLSPALDVLPEEDGSRLFKIAISRVIKKHSDQIEPAAQRMGRDGSGTGFGKRPDWREDIQRIVNLARANQLSHKDLIDCAKCSWDSLKELFGPASDKDVSSKLNTAVDSAIVSLENIKNISKGTSKTLDELKKLQKLRYKGRDIPWVEWVRLSKLGTNKDGEGILDNVNRIAEEVLNHPVFQRDVQQMINGVFQCAAEALESYESFKTKQGLMDFVDQETIVLALARNNMAFQKSMKNRLKILMVDEFQDTSPIQLALFLELNKLAGQSVWVGDPKQAIYGFRGTDPQLMIEVSKLISNTGSLDKSWRSKKLLVDFCNAVFSKVFHEMGSDKVCLNIPDERKEKAKGGWIETWNLPVQNNAEEVHAIANGIKSLLSRKTGLKPSEIAILCRTNSQCEMIASSLEKIGIRASATQGALMEAKECQLAIAALKYLNYNRDTVALAEIVHLSPAHSFHDKWLESLMTNKFDAIKEWMKDPTIAGLDQARDNVNHWTPLEALEYSISNIGLLRTIKSWSNPELRLGNLDKLRGCCVKYLDQCRARKGAATIAGFISYLQETTLGKAQGSGDQTVQVLTYHGAKGLEWPVVVLASLDSESKASAFGADIVASPFFDPANPLANRSIRFWPWPFDTQRSFPLLDSRLESRQEDIVAKELAKRESHRLMYVGMTRARDGMIFAIRKNITQKSTSLKTAWLDELTDESGNNIISWPLESGDNEIVIPKEPAKNDVVNFAIPISVYEYTIDNIEADTIVYENYVSLENSQTQEYPPARISPSSLATGTEDLSDVIVTLITDFGHLVEIKGKPDAVALGNAFHGILGVNAVHQDETLLRDIALGSLQRWDVDQSLNIDDVLTARNNLFLFVGNKYPDSKVFCEWPITEIYPNMQLMQGWIDMLLETQEGYVIIDHKTYSGSDNQEHVKQYASQITAYKRAIEKATNKRVLSTLIHLPIAGQIFELSLK